MNECGYDWKCFSLTLSYSDIAFLCLLDLFWFAGKEGDFDRGHIGETSPWHPASNWVLTGSDDFFMTFFFLIASTLNIPIYLSLLIDFPFAWELERMLGSLSKVFSSRSFQAFSFDIWKSNPRHPRRYLHILGEFLTFFLSVLNFHALPIIYSY